MGRCRSSAVPLVCVDGQSDVTMNFFCATRLLLLLLLLAASGSEKKLSSLKMATGDPVMRSLPVSYTEAGRGSRYKNTLWVCMPTYLPHISS